MNKALKIILIIGIAIIICGAGMSVAGYSMGGLKSIVITSNGLEIVDESDTSQFEEVNQTFENINSLSIDLDFMNYVTIREGDVLNVSGACNTLYGGLKTELTSGGALSVKHSSQDKTMFGEHGIATIGIANISGTDIRNKNHVEITIPKTTSLSSINLVLSDGWIAIEDAVANNIDINQGSGDISAKNLTCDVLNVDSSYGNIELNDVRTHHSSFDLSMGNLIANRIFVENKLSVDNSYGGVILLGDIKGESMINMRSGDMELKLAGEEKDYRTEAETALGEIVIDGQEFNSPYHSPLAGSGTLSAPNKLTIHSDYGEVHVSFGSRAASR